MDLPATARKRTLYLLPGADRLCAPYTGFITALLNRHDLKVDDADAILDFGCGCGRIARHFRSLKKAKLYGTDYNPELVAWCQRNLPFAEFGVNQLQPPLPYADAKFGFILCFLRLHPLPRSTPVAMADRALESIEARWAPLNDHATVKSTLRSICRLTAGTSLPPADWLL